MNSNALLLVTACAACVPPGAATSAQPAAASDQAAELDYSAVGPLGPKVDLRAKQHAPTPLPPDDDPRVQTHHTQLRCVKDHATVNVFWTTFRDGNTAYVLSVWAQILRIAPNNKLTVDSIEPDDANGAVATYALLYGMNNVFYSADLHADGTAKRDPMECP